MPNSIELPQRLPPWLKRTLPKGNASHFTQRTLENLQLETVCSNAKCPNRMECYAKKTAAFLLLGPVCTRNCRFCAVVSGIPKPIDETEPLRTAQAVQKLGLSHVVLTCVSRDDLPDGGAEHFCNTIRAIRNLFAKENEQCPAIEVLPSDFAGNFESVNRLADMLPDVYNYNTETVPRLFPAVRGAIPNFERTLEMFRSIRNRQPSIQLKSGLMLGLGETNDEVFEVLRQLYSAGCQVITIGQYLRPSKECMPVQRYVPPEEFEEIGIAAKEIGFLSVSSSPFVRSSYHAAVVL
jgi:lipoic acid synthetase